MHEQSRRGMSLVEMLVVVGVIALLIAILIPALSSAREAARNVECKVNQRQLGVGIAGFALDNHEHLPGVYTWDEPDPSRQDWISGRFGSVDDMMRVWEHGPDRGTLFPYAGMQGDVYRCPSLNAGLVGSGLGSNGRYDYTMIGGFGGARMHMLPDELRVEGVQNTVRPSVLLVEEDPGFYLNRQGSLAGSFAARDRIGVQHNGLSNFTGVDGSVHTIPRFFAWREGFELRAVHPLWREREIAVGIDPPAFDWWGGLALGLD